MKLTELNKILKYIDTVNITGDAGITITGIEFDSRKIAKDNLFVAIRGSMTDGHNFISKAEQKGASCIICEELPVEINESVCYILVNDSNKALGLAASAYYNFPSKDLKLIGITGTNGKTTIATLLYYLLTRLGFKTGLLSTVAIHICENIYETSHTTPDAIKLNYMLREMVEAGCEYCFMEVSSHSVVQERIAGLQFAGGIFTNLTHEHLDYHKTFIEYLNAKKRLFDNLTSGSFALVNADDKNGMVMIQNTKAHKYSFALKNMSDFSGSVLEVHTDGMLIKIQGKEVWTNFIGEFNASNLLAVFGAASLLNIDSDECLRIISELKPVRGRFETIRSASGILAIIDYAHTPDALKNVLETIKNLIKPGKKILTVIGAGGNRDKEKRPQMAAIATNISDKVILTSDNPRDEEPETIISEMESGISVNLRHKYLKITDRREAIKTACMIASPGDIVLIAGKGHETYQEVNGVRTHFDDKEEAEKVFLLLTNSN